MEVYKISSGRYSKFYGEVHKKHLKQKDRFSQYKTFFNKKKQMKAEDEKSLALFERKKIALNFGNKN